MPAKKKASKRKPAAKTPPAVETFPNPEPKREYVIEFDCPEFTSVCPKTGLPDFGTIRITYAPKRDCLEMKSLKMYFYGYRNQGAFYEAVVNRILTDLVASCRPRWMEVVGEFNVRGGMGATVTARYG
ncbi:MAG: preQ(1) synthase [Planctomycetota bacterium]|jgi:7-cyano-7-deazaguanine reductase